MIGLGGMGTNMMRRLIRAGHQSVVYDIHSEAVRYQFGGREKFGQREGA